MKILITGVLVLFGLSLCPVLTAADFNGDGKDDIAIFRESAGLWAVRGVTRAYFGRKLDIPVPGDYGGGAADEIAIFRPSAGLWAAKGVTWVYFGASGDIPLGQSGLKESDNFFYDQAKWAFRAGRATGGQWNDQSVGKYSVAMGNSTMASGKYSTAMGALTTASGDFSTAMGNNTTASGSLSTAMGKRITVSGYESFGYGTSDSNGFDVSTDKVFVIHGANVGIGTTSPNTKLAVNGLTGTSSYNYVKVNTSTGDFYYDTSSERYKKNIRNLEGDFRRILEAKPKVYVDKASGQEEIGYVAEDFDGMGLNKLVIYDKEGRPDGLKYERITVYLVELVKEQQKKISELEQKIAGKEGQVN